MDEWLFKELGPWHTRWRIGDRDYGGDYDAMHDPRIGLALTQFGPSLGRVLELGPQEGGHTFGLSAHAASVLAVDGRPSNVVKARYMQSVLGITNVDFRLANLEEMDLAQLGRFDLCFCVGLLYHLPRPWELLERIAAVTDRLFLWTHYALDAEADYSPRSGLTGKQYPEYGWHDPLSGLSPWSFWPTRTSLLAMLAEAGFGEQKVLDDTPRPHPALTLVTLLR